MIGNDAAITWGGASGAFELNVYIPMMARNPNHGGARPGTGPKPKTATIKTDAPLRISQSWPTGDYADLGKGHALIERQGSSRIILVPQEDGSTIRIWVF